MSNKVYATRIEAMVVLANKKNQKAFRVEQTANGWWMVVKA